MKTVDILHEQLTRPLFHNVTLTLAAQLLAHDEHLYMSVRHKGRVIFDKSNKETEAADILKVLEKITASI